MNRYVFLMRNYNMNNNNNNSNSLDLAAIYGISPYVERKLNAPVPSLEEIAAYSAYERQQRLRPEFNQIQTNQTGQSNTTQTTPPATRPSTVQPSTSTSSSQLSSQQQPTSSTPMTQISESQMGTTSASQPTMLSSTMTSLQNSTSNELEPIMPYDQPFPVTAESIQYLNGFLRTQLGRYVRLEFLVGTSNLEIRQGILLAVGANFILINVENSDDLMACDFYNLKFVTLYY